MRGKVITSYGAKPNGKAKAEDGGVDYSGDEKLASPTEQIQLPRRSGVAFLNSFRVVMVPWNNRKFVVRAIVRTVGASKPAY